MSPTKTASNDESVVKRVFIVDDHPLMRQGLMSALNVESDLTVCGEASSAEEAVSSVVSLKPDLVITDLSLPEKGGLDLIKDLKSLCSDIPVIVLSMHDECIHGERALRAGARGYLMKSSGPDELIEAIRRVLQGEVFVSENMRGRILESLSGRSKRGGRSSEINKLTDREFEVFKAIGEGNRTVDIAKKLHISPKTVEAHNAKIRQKLKLSSFGDLTVYAIRWVESQG